MKRVTAAPELPVVSIVRDRSDEEGTFGVLTICHRPQWWSCYTLEDPWRNNAQGVSCIPAGEYRVTWEHSPKYQRHTYRLHDVPGRSGILIHPGNSQADTAGCILLGSGFAEIDGNDRIYGSKDAVERFESIMAQQPFTLRIDDLWQGIK